jgi:hypothetical protein
VWVLYSFLGSWNNEKQRVRERERKHHHHHQHHHQHNDDDEHVHTYIQNNTDEHPTTATGSSEEGRTTRRCAGGRELEWRKGKG